jgi:TPR repeat protein
MDVRPKLSAKDLCQQAQSHQEKKDYKEAKRCYKEAANLGYFRGQAELGTMYLTGEGCKKNRKKAYDLMLKAAQQGHARSQYNVAMMLERGDGVEQNITEAIHWYQEAAKQKFVGAPQRVQQLQQQLQQQQKSAYNFNSI